MLCVWGGVGLSMFAYAQSENVESLSPSASKNTYTRAKQQQQKRLYAVSHRGSVSFHVDVFHGFRADLTEWLCG